MPPYKRQRLYTKKKNYARRYKPKRKYKKYTSKVTIPRLMVNSGLGFPKKMTVTHKYIQHINQSSTLGTINKFWWTANGMYDPNISGTGHSPLYFDQLSALYNHYHVIGSEISIRFPPTNVGYIAGILVEDDNTNAFTAWDQFAEQTQAKLKYILPTSTMPVTITQKWSAKKTFGGSILGNDELQGTISANPTEQSYFLSYFQAIDKISDVPTISLLVEIRYIAIWTELKEVAQS